MASRPTAFLSLPFLVRVVIFTALYALIGAIFPLQQAEVTPGYVIGLVITGVLYGFLLGFLGIHLTVGRWARIGILLLPLYVIQFLNPLIEGYFFTTLLEDATQLVGALILTLLLSLVYAAAAGFLFAPTGAPQPWREAFRSYFGSRPAPDWIWRFVVAGASWPLIYFAFGSLVGPIVTPYYTDPNSGYNLVLPSVEVLLVIQAVRGFLYVGALVPLLSALRLGTRSLTLALTGLLYVGGGVAIFIIVETFPPVLRLVHGLEIFADSLVFGVVIALLLGRTHGGSGGSPPP